MALGAGSIAFTGINTDDNDALAFVAIESIAAGATIHFTSGIWNKNTLAFDEAVTIAWTAGAAVTAGTVVILSDLFDDDALLTPSASTGSLGAVTALDRSAANFGMVGTYFGFFAHTGDLANPDGTFLAAISTEFEINGVPFVGYDGTTNLPAELGLGQTAIWLATSFNSAAIAAYVGPRNALTGDIAIDSAAINGGSWAVQISGGAAESTDGIAPDLPFDATPFVSPTPPVTFHLIDYSAGSLLNPIDRPDPANPGGLLPRVENLDVNVPADIVVEYAPVYLEKPLGDVIGPVGTGVPHAADDNYHIIATGIAGFTYITTGGGDDLVELGSFAAETNAGNGDDTIKAGKNVVEDGITFGGSGVIDGGAGDDILVVGGSTSATLTSIEEIRFDSPLPTNGSDNYSYGLEIGNFNSVTSTLSTVRFNTSAQSFDTITINADQSAGAPVTVDLSGVAFLNGDSFQIGDTVFDDLVRINGTTYGDTLIGGLNVRNMISGQEGNDVIRGGDEASGTVSFIGDFLYGGGGNDTIEGRDGTDYLYGDNAFNSAQANGDDRLIGGAGYDTIWGSHRLSVAQPGSADSDTAVYFGNFADYAITSEFSSFYQRKGVGVLDDNYQRDGQDLLFDIEYLEFADRTVRVADLFPLTDTIPLAVADIATTSEDMAVLIDVLANDTDADGDSLTLVSASIANGALGTVVVSAGKLLFTPAANINGNVTLSYVMRDTDGNNVEGTVGVTVTPVNDAPDTITLSQTSFAEDTTIWTTLGLFSARDIDGDTLTYSLADTDGGPFDIRGRRFVSNGTFDYETRPSYDIKVDVSDGTTIVQKTIRIDITDVLEPPVNLAPTGLAFSRTTVVENTAIGYSLGLLKATDPEGGTLRWTMTDDADGAFRLLGRKVMIAGPIDYEATPEISFTAEVTDSAGNSVSKTFTLDVIDQPEVLMASHPADHGLLF